MIKKTFVIGRHGDIRIDDDSVSKRHAELQLRNNQVYLRDLGSTNGIYLIKNNRPIRFYEGYVQFNQIVAIGRKVYRISEILDQINQLSFEIKYYRCA